MASQCFGLRKINFRVNLFRLLQKNKKVERIHIQQTAIAIQKEDSLYFNQLSGKEIIAHIDSGELRRVHVNGNAETIYYPRDEADSTLIGLNKTESSFVVMYLKNKKAERIVMTSATSGIMYPIGQLSGGDLYLKNFFWLEEQRPANSSEVMLYYAKKTREKPGTSSLMGAVPKTESKSKDSPAESGNSGRTNPGNANKRPTQTIER